MTIGIVTTSYPRFVGDPAGGFVAGHVAALRALGHSVEVIAAADGHARTEGPRRHRHHPDGVTRIPARLFYAGGAPERLEATPLRAGLAGLAFTAKLTAAIARRRWSSIVAHWIAPSAIAALPSRVPLLAIAHGGDVHTLRRMHLLAPVLHLLRARNARLVFVSEQLRTIARDAVAGGLRRWLDEATVQPMGIAVDHFRGLGRAPSDPPTIAIASRLVPVKGIDVAIAAMAHVRAPARLVIAGDGPARGALLSHAQKVAAPIEFRGELSAADRDRLLASASAVVVPSRVLSNGRTEGTPTIALEALATGVPVIGSAVGGLAELPSVVHVPPEDPHALAASIDRTLVDPPTPEVLRQAVAHLDWSQVAPILVATRRAGRSRSVLRTAAPGSQVGPTTCHPSR